MAVDGSITIGAIFTTDKFDRQIAKFEKDMQDTEDKLELKLNAKIQAENELKKHKQDIFDLEQEYEKLVPKVERYNELMSQSKAGINLSPKDFQFISEIQNSNVLSQYDKMGSQLDRMYAKEERLNAKVQQKAYAYKQVADKVDEYKQKIENVKIQKQVADVEKLKSEFKSVGSSIQKSITNVARLAIGIFGVRSAYLALRRASSDLASYDKQYASNLEYIRYALTQAIAPVLQWIVNLAARLLGYINAIMQGWFGINLFSRGSAENFEKMKKSTSKASKAVKEIKKQLVGFDEINMLTKQSDTGTKSGAGGVGTPDFDLSAMQGDTPPWLKWIIDNRDKILGILAGIAGGLIAIKFGLGAIKALGIGIAIKGIVDLITSLRDYLNDPSWENFGKVVKAIGEIILGVGILIGNVPAIVAGAIVLITGLIIKYWDEIHSFINNSIKNIQDFIQSIIDWFTEKSEWVHERFGNIVGSIYDFFVGKIKAILTYAKNQFEALKQIFNGILTFIKEVFTGNWKKAWDGLKQVVSGFVNLIISKFNYVLDLLKNKIAFFGNVIGNIFGGAFKGVVNAVLRTIENVVNSPIRAINSLISVINGVPGINLGYLSTFNLPRLAVGGIVNMPNRGTLIGGAIAGESGREGVIPLTDQQAMSQLGREIGKNVVVNLTNVTKMNGRVIGRELKQVSNEQDFAFNN